MPPKRRGKVESSGVLEPDVEPSISKESREIFGADKKLSNLKAEKVSKIKCADMLNDLKSIVKNEAEDGTREEQSKLKNFSTDLSVKVSKKRKRVGCSTVTTPTHEANESSNKKIKLQSGKELRCLIIDEKQVISVGQHVKSNKYVGAHTSIAGGLFKAIEEAIELGASSIGMFLKSQRTWKSKELDEKSIKLFKENVESSGILPEMIIPHGSYLLNCGSVNKEILQKSRDCLIDELKRCELLDIPMYNFHPGSAKDSTPERCIELIAESINLAHSQTKCVVTLIENMSNQGNTVGGDFSQLKSIIEKVKDKSRVGICLDTCHAFAAGYDLKSKEGYESTKKEFDEIIGRKYLKAVHLNDSKGDVGCHLDRHESIGKGKLGLEFFARLMNDPFFDGIALVLETPDGNYKEEINLLYSLIK